MPATGSASSCTRSDTHSPSLLIAKGLNVVFVSRQLGHANATITLEVYAHLFEQADHAVAARNALDASHSQRMTGSATT